jgi:hypothetical protein
VGSNKSTKNLPNPSSQGATIMTKSRLFRVLMLSLAMSNAFSLPQAAPRLEDKKPNPTEINRQGNDRLDLRQTGLGRISHIEGKGTLQVGKVGDVEPLSVNVPLRAGDFVYTDDISRLEMQFPGAFVRLDNSSEITLGQLSPSEYRFEIGRGTAAVTVNAGRPQRVELVTPQGRVKVNKSGTYRVTVSPSGNVEIATQKGELEVITVDSTLKVKDGQQVMLNALNPFEKKSVTAVNTVALDSWVAERDRIQTIEITSNGGYLGGVRTVGLAELGRYGEWIDVVGRGRGWRPRYVSASWSPYQVGQWRFYNRLGWTWVSDETWGWLPYHTGRWEFVANFGWVWFGDEDPFWASAIVSWYRLSINNVNYLWWQPRRYIWENTDSFNGGTNVPTSNNSDGVVVGHVAGGRCIVEDTRGVTVADLPKNGTTLVPEQDFGKGVVVPTTTSIGSQLKPDTQLEPIVLKIEPSKTKTVDTTAGLPGVDRGRNFDQPQGGLRGTAINGGGSAVDINRKITGNVANVPSVGGPRPVVNQVPGAGEIVKTGKGNTITTNSNGVPVVVGVKPSVNQVPNGGIRNKEGGLVVAGQPIGTTGVGGFKKHDKNDNSDRGNRGDRGDRNNNAGNANNNNANNTNHSNNTGHSRMDRPSVSSGGDNFGGGRTVTASPAPTVSPAPARDIQPMGGPTGGGRGGRDRN